MRAILVLSSRLHFWHIGLFISFVFLQRGQTGPDCKCKGGIRFDLANYGFEITSSKRGGMYGSTGPGVRKSAQTKKQKVLPLPRLTSGIC